VRNAAQVDPSWDVRAEPWRADHLEETAGGAPRPLTHSPAILDHRRAIEELAYLCVVHDGAIVRFRCIGVSPSETGGLIWPHHVARACVPHAT